ncbi:MAG: ABC transporter ATP-binding protein [Acidimicrobiia bacterium]|nr:ABC transporter ATP-binding protein [Acidimicrobiia bacterium]
MLTCHASAARNGFRLEVDLEAATDEIVAVVGPNGAGKSSLLRILAGLDPVEAGQIVVDGDVWEDPAASIRRLPEERSVGYVPQAGLLFPHLSVRENVAFGCAEEEEADVWLGRLGLEDLIDARPSELSGGQAQLVALARAQVRRPALLLLDEPLASVDAANRAAVRRVLRRQLHDSPGYRILVTHDPLEAAALADRIVVLDNGRVTQDGTIDDLRTHPRSTYVAELVGMNFFSGEASGGTITLPDGGVIVSASTLNGAALASVHPRAVSLYLSRPTGSPRNVWLGHIASIEPSLEQVRVHVTGPVDLVAEVTHAGADAFSEGDDVWVALKASEVLAYPR